MTTKTVTKGTLIAKIVITFVAVVLGFAILQTVLGLFWESERLGWNLVPTSLYVGGIYLLYFFLCTRRHAGLILFITLVIVVGIIAVTMSASNEPLRNFFTGWSIAPCIRALYYIVMFRVADYFGEPIRIKKQAEYMRKKMEKQSKEDSENQN